MSDPSASRRRRMPAGERRRAILDAARAEFAHHGFHGAGTAAIAREAGCSEAILYRHFASKRDLLIAVLRDEVARRVEAGRAIAPAPQPGAPGLPEVLRARLREGDMETTARLVLQAVALADDPEVSAAVREAFAAVRAPLRSALEAAQAAGAVRDDIEAESLTWLWHGLFLVAAVRNAIAPDGVALQAVDAAEALAALLAPPSGAS